jgi:hypothetical protein
MPAKSKAQFRLMQAAAHGKLRKKGGPSRAVAQEFVSGQSPKGLPEKAKKTKYDGDRLDDQRVSDRLAADAEDQETETQSYLLGGRR